VSVRTEQPLAFAFGMFVGAIVADLCLIGGELLAYAIHWRDQLR
jgi:hypothetical protein